jgi:hypothetical protein
MGFRGIFLKHPSQKQGITIVLVIFSYSLYKDSNPFRRKTGFDSSGLTKYAICMSRRFLANTTHVLNITISEERSSFMIIDNLVTSYFTEVTLRNTMNTLLFMRAITRGLKQRNNGVSFGTHAVHSGHAAYVVRF